MRAASPNQHARVLYLRRCPAEAVLDQAAQLGRQLLAMMRVFVAEADRVLERHDDVLRIDRAIEVRRQLDLVHHGAGTVEFADGFLEHAMHLAGAAIPPWRATDTDARRLPRNVRTSSTSQAGQHA